MKCGYPRYLKAIQVVSLGLVLTQAQVQAQAPVQAQVQAQAPAQPQPQPFAVSAAKSAALGEDGLYATLCSACHGHGTASIGPYPPLFGSAILATAGPAYIAIKALRGSGNMLPLCSLASDEELTRLANDLAQANSSGQPAITLAEVATLRPAADECPDVK